MKKFLITLMISAVTVTCAASAASVTSTSNLGAGYHLITSAVGQCTGTENCTIPYGDKICDADSLGVVYRMATANPDGTYSYEDQKCIWGDDSMWIVDTYMVTKGGKDFSCPVVAAGPLTSTTNNWPPTRFEGLTPEQFVYCNKSN